MSLDHWSGPPRSFGGSTVSLNRLAVGIELEPKRLLLCPPLNVPNHLARLAVGRGSLVHICSGDLFGFFQPRQSMSANHLGDTFQAIDDRLGIVWSFQHDDAIGHRHGTELLEQRFCVGRGGLVNEMCVSGRKR